VVIPRLIAAGADLELVGVVGVKAEGRTELVTFPDDLPELEERIRETQARLLTIDPVVGALSGQVDSHKHHSIRRVLGPLAQLAERCDISIGGTIHMNKSAVSDLLNRISGSKGFVIASRSVLVFARDPNDVDGDEGYERVIVHAKSNWGRYAPALAARVEERRLGTDETQGAHDHPDPACQRGARLASGAARLLPARFRLSQQDRRPAHRADTDRYWKEVRTRARIERDFYSCSKHYGCWYLKVVLTLPDAVIAAQAGWSERSVAKMVETYAHAVDERRLDEIDAAFQTQTQTHASLIPHLERD
jgi:hypothetical protein